jgi:hypothetical protein
MEGGECRTYHAGDDVHREDDGPEDGEFAEDVGVLLGAFVHADVDLGDVIAVGAGEEARRREEITSA